MRGFDHKRVWSHIWWGRKCLKDWEVWEKLQALRLETPKLQPNKSWTPVERRRAGGVAPGPASGGLSRQREEMQRQLRGRKCPWDRRPRTIPCFKLYLAPFMIKKEHTGNILLSSYHLMNIYWQLDEGETVRFSNSCELFSESLVSTCNRQIWPAPNHLILNDVDVSNTSRKLCRVFLLSLCEPIFWLASLLYSEPTVFCYLGSFCLWTLAIWVHDSKNLLCLSKLFC